MLDINIFFVSV